MKPVVVIAAACLLLALLQPVLSIKCYVCTNTKGNCNENNKDCPSSSIIKYDRCLKIKVGDVVTKSCSTKALCDVMKFCDGKSECKASCCDSDGCNASSALAPKFVLVCVAAMVTKYLM
ncbi:uncharacterized protein LOC110234147 isoform X1 [Exaiptasia diaphana]|uniref:Uncharacterized protein n=1 Tax=Exaiptasia diaphana TaxID=2652724 RepID=A0A913YED5_EXADI|nr:uncharacterized protein LOC110234147 isoform X2 [Exaiptasia diaphana]XP_028513399.1 uncharacterized protein LOC110234147 isoform X1 [Exaiptasia diaphana]